MALTDDDVQKQIKNMISFIEQEAKEKVEEIESKAEEEFEIEKSRLVQDQRSKMKEYYSKEEKKLDQRKKIQESNLTNQSRLKVLACRQQNVRGVLEETKRRLKELSKDAKQYKETMRGLIIQGLFQLLEKKVIVTGRREDVSLIESLIKECATEYEKKTKIVVDVVINKESFLGAGISGGVELTVPNGRLKVVNTLESRLELISQQMIPEVREILFGINDNRKFQD